jgi:hypothetical protein
LSFGGGELFLLESLILRRPCRPVACNDFVFSKRS